MITLRKPPTIPRVNIPCLSTGCTARATHTFTHPTLPGKVSFCSDCAANYVSHCESHGHQFSLNIVRD